ncbi:MAG TPA: hypothetical protein VMR37_02175 [Rhabdochlamydiaceae bacterium]|nr:hypothetical protein [Rhabdochlamydiaceae bacterium]
MSLLTRIEGGIFRTEPYFDKLNPNPPAAQKIDRTAQGNFLKNYQEAAMRSRELGWLTLGCTVATLIGGIKRSPLLALAFAIAGVISFNIWILRANDPNNLLYQAYQALKNNKDQDAIQAIQKGANLDGFDNTRGLLEEAAHRNRLSVVQFLTSLGCKLNNCHFLLFSVFPTAKGTFERTVVTQERLDTIQFLIDQGMPVRPGNALMVQFYNLEEDLISNNIHPQYNIEQEEFNRILIAIDRRCKVIKLLKDKGLDYEFTADLARQDADIYQAFIQKINALPNKDGDERTTAINGLIKFWENLPSEFLNSRKLKLMFKR